MSGTSLSFRLRRLVSDMVTQTKRLRLQQTAASLAFLSLFAAVPMFSIAFSVLASLPVFERLRIALQDFLAHNLFPEEFSDTVLQYLEEFANRSHSLSVAGTAIFLMTAVTALRMIEEAMNAIWHSERRRPFHRRVVLYWTLLTLGPLTLAALLAVNGLFVAEFLRGGELAWLRSFWASMLTFLVGVGVLLLMFRSLPEARVGFVHALAGAVVAAVWLALLQRLLGWGIHQLHTYEVVYGAMAILPVLLIWLFLAWSIVLAGAVLASALKRWDAPSDDPEPNHAPGRRFADALQVLAALPKVGPSGIDVAIAVEQLRADFDDDAQRLDLAGQLLERTGYLTRLASVSDPVSPRAVVPGRAQASGRRVLGPIKHRIPIWQERWAWAQPPDALTLRRLFDELWWEGRPGPVQSWQGRELDRPLSRITEH